MATQLKNPERPQPIPFDAPGIGLLAVALGSLQFVLDEGERSDWFDDTKIVVATAAFVVFLTGFIWWELAGTRNRSSTCASSGTRNVRTGSIVALTLGMVVFRSDGDHAAVRAEHPRFTATLSGLLVFLRAIPVLLLTPLVARLAGRMDGRLLLFTGFTTSAVSFYLLATAMTSGSDFGSFAVPLLVSGVGQSMLLVPLLVTVIGNRPAAGRAPRPARSRRSACSSEVRSPRPSS